MPMHDWRRVTPNVYHMLHGAWLITIARALNNGFLPAGYYAMSEQVTRQATPDIVALRPPGTPVAVPAVHRAAATAPAVGLLDRAEHLAPKRPRRRLAVRHNSTHQVVAVIELVSRGDKADRRDFQAFVGKAANVLHAGVHLLVVDPFPPTRRDPNGIHPAVWAAVTRPRKYRPPYQPPADHPLTAASYRAGGEMVAAVEAFAVGGPVPAMPLWLAEDLWVAVPLDDTYSQAFADVPAVWRDALAGPCPAHPA